MGQASGTSTAVWRQWGWYLLLGSLTLALVGVMGSRAVACTDFGRPYDPFVSPGGDPEIYDGVDNDCDATNDEELGGPPSFRVVQLALVDADPDQLEIGDTAAVTALVRVNLDAEFDRAELRTGDGGWVLMTATPRATFTKDTDVSGVTAPFDTSGDVQVCVRAFDELGTVSDEGCVTVAVAPADPGVVFEGFGSPVGPDNELVGARAGRAVPLTFALLVDGVAVTSTAEVQVVTVPLSDGCEPQDGEAADAEDAGRSKLRYNADEAHFVFSWKTERDWAGTCRAVEVVYGGEVVGAATVTFAG